MNDLDKKRYGNIFNFFKIFKYLINFFLYTIVLNRCVPTVNEDNINSLMPYFKGKITLNQNELKTIFDITQFLEQICFYTLNYRYTYIKYEMGETVDLTFNILYIKNKKNIIKN